EHRAIRIETGLAQPLAHCIAPVPPLHDLGEPRAFRGIEAEDLAEVAQCALRPVHDHGRGDRRPLPTVFIVDILDHLLPPLVLEVDIDIGRFIALTGYEALEEERCAAQRVDGGNSQAVTDAGVRGRPPTLTQNPFAARKSDDVVDGQEVRLVAQIRDELELVLDRGALTRRHALRPAPVRARLRQLAQMTRRSLTFRHELMRILIPQLFQREGTTSGDGYRFLEELARIELREPLALAQIPLAVGIEPPAGLRNGHVVPNCGDRILEPPTGADVHMNIAAGHQRQRQLPADQLQRLEMSAIHPIAKQLDGDPQPPAEVLFEPARLLGIRRLEFMALRPGSRASSLPGQPEDETVLEPILLEISACQRVSALGRSPPATRDEPAEPAVATPVGGQCDELQTTGETQLRADDELQLLPFCRNVSTHDTGNGALVRDRERLVAQLNRLPYELVRMRCPAQEGKVGEAVQLGVRSVGDQPKTPWRNHRCGGSRSRNTHSRAPRTS